MLRPSPQLCLLLLTTMALGCEIEVIENATEYEITKCNGRPPALLKHCNATHIENNWVELRFKNIQSIEPKAFASIPQLQRLDLSGNCLEIIDEEAFRELVWLETLDLRGNKIKLVEPGAFDTLKSLRFLLMAGNAVRIQHSWCPNTGYCEVS